jgi:hypothetical protein
MHTWVYGCMDVIMDGWRFGWMDGGREGGRGIEGGIGWINGNMDGCILGSSYTWYTKRNKGVV